MVNETVEGNAITRTIEFLNGLFTDIITKIVVAIVIILVGFVIGKILGRLTQRLLHELEFNKIFKRATKLSFSLEELIGKFVSYFIYFIALIMALNQIGLTTIILYMVTAAIIVLLIISIFLGIKDFIPNMIAGIFIHQKRVINEGDIIKVKNLTGKIVHINLVETRIKTKDGDIIYIPNSMLTNTEIVRIKKSKVSQASK